VTAHGALPVQTMSVPVTPTGAFPHARISHRRVAGVTLSQGDAPVSHQVKRHTECCNCTAKIGHRTQSLVAPMSYANPYATYKLRACHGSKSRVSERPENDYTQTLI
jgi:hypothetical protein